MNTSRKANTIKDLQGTFRKDRDAKSQDQMRGEVLEKIPSAPRRLNRQAKKAWRDIGTMLVKTNTLQNIDLAVFEELANLFGWCRYFRNKLDDGPEAFAVTSERLAYEKKAKYWHSEYQRYHKLFTDLARRFGMDPSSRSQVQPPLAGRQLSITDIIKGDK